MSRKTPGTIKRGSISSMYFLLYKNLTKREINENTIDFLHIRMLLKYAKPMKWILFISIVIKFRAALINFNSK